MENTKTKVDLITGFLGAGKTTFISKYGSYLKNNGKKYVVIENEFGAAGVDVTLLQQQGVDVTSLAGGCICCTLKVGFVQAMAELSKTYDRILVEPSGIFTVEDFYEALSSPLLDECCEAGFITAIVDPETVSRLDKTELSDEHTVFTSQIKGCGSVLFSKITDMSSDEIDGLISRFKALCDKCGIDISEKPVIAAPEFNFSDEQVETIINSKSEAMKKTAQYVNHAMIFQSSTIYPNKDYGYDEIVSKLNAVFDVQNGYVMRAKGYVNAESGGMYMINCTPDNYSIVHTDNAIQPMINIIGKKMKRSAFKLIFE